MKEKEEHLHYLYLLHPQFQFLKESSRRKKKQ